MPGDDGLTLTKEIRESSDIPIILLTAKSGMESKIEGFEISHNQLSQRIIDIRISDETIKKLICDAKEKFV